MKPSKTASAASILSLISLLSSLVAAGQPRAAEREPLAPDFPAVREFLGRAAEQAVPEAKGSPVVGPGPEVRAQEPLVPRSFSVVEKSCTLGCFYVTVKDSRGRPVELGELRHLLNLTYKDMGGNELARTERGSAGSRYGTFLVLRGADGGPIGRVELEAVREGWNGYTVYRLADELTGFSAESARLDADAETVVLRGPDGAEAVTIRRDFDRDKLYDHPSALQYEVAAHLLPWPIAVDQWDVEVKTPDLDPLLAAALAALRSERARTKR